MFELPLELFRGKDAARKGKEREEIAYAAAEIARKKFGGHQHNVSGLGVCEDMIADSIGIGVLKAAAERKKGGEQHGVGDLAFCRPLVSLHESSFLSQMQSCLHSKSIEAFCPYCKRSAAICDECTDEAEKALIPGILQGNFAEMLDIFGFDKYKS